MSLQMGDSHQTPCVKRKGLSLTLPLRGSSQVETRGRVTEAFNQRLPNS